MVVFSIQMFSVTNIFAKSNEEINKEIDKKLELVNTMEHSMEEKDEKIKEEEKKIADLESKIDTVTSQISRLKEQLNNLGDDSELMLTFFQRQINSQDSGLLVLFNDGFSEAMEVNNSSQLLFDEFSRKILSYDEKMKQMNEDKKNLEEDKKTEELSKKSLQDERKSLQLEEEKQYKEIDDLKKMTIKETPGKSSGGKPSMSQQEMMKSAGIRESDYGHVTFIVNRESGWNHLAVNSSSGAYGLCQALPAEKMASAGGDWKDNPITQLKWCNGYAVGRYGSWSNAHDFWIKNNWW